MITFEQLLTSVGVLGIVFLILSISGLAGWVNNYDSKEEIWQIFFKSMAVGGLVGASICFIAAIILMIIGGYNG